MKELSVEEKAEHYDEVVNKLRRFMEQSVNPLITRADVQDFFPQLKDSGDERIRKELIAHCRNTRCVTEEGAERIAKWISWLEKQAEHANFRNKIQVDDRVTRNEDGVLVNLSQLDRIAKQDKNNMGISEATKQELKDNLNKVLAKETPESWNEFLDEQKSVDKVEPKF